MRLKIKFRPTKRKVNISCNYNGYIQAFIYAFLDKWIATKLHDEGFTDLKTKSKFKFFTFSRLIPTGKHYIKDGRIYIQGDIILHITSYLDEFIRSFCENLIKTGEFFLNDELMKIESVSIESVPKYRKNVLVRTLSPITIYSTFTTSEGRKKTYYYRPFEKEFGEYILNNLNKKLRTLTGREVSGGSINPFKVTPEDERIVIYKGTVIKGWDGVFELSLPKELFNLAFETGLGAKNSQGFGCIELWNEK
ncbi:MAG: CRISPR-associated endoribonuclease Cas6 [Candidatus Kapaibacteriota bacterium]